MQVQWGISGVKRKWKCFMKRINSRKPRYVGFFQAIIIFTNFLHKRCMELTYEAVGDQNFDLVAHD
jgi:hypothetical protein